MTRGVLLGFFRWILPVPAGCWDKKFDGMLQQLKEKDKFMTGEHRTLYGFAIMRLVETVKSLTSEEAAQKLNLPLERVNQLLDELEKRAGVITRHADGAIVSAGPVTLDKTSQRLVLSLGEEIQAEGMLHALGAAYVAGKLRGLPVFGHITTPCSYCHEPRHIIIGNDLKFRVLEAGASPLVFLPLPGRNTGKHDDLNQLGKDSVLFCSREHAAAYRKKAGRTRGVYLTLEQAVGTARSIHGVIPGMPDSG